MLSNGTVGVLLGNGDGTFQTAVTYGSGGYWANSVAVADVNGDGKPDLLVANFCVSTAVVQTARWACCWAMVTEPSRQR